LLPPIPKGFNPPDHYIHCLAVEPGNEDESRSVIGAVVRAFRDKKNDDHDFGKGELP